MADESGAGLQGARDKAAEYADRIRAGASAHTVCEGLGPVFRESVMRLVEADASRQDLSVLCELETGKFTEFLQRALQRPAWGWSPGEDLFVHGASVADGTRYDAHGIAKGTLTDQIACLVGLLETGPDTARQFHTAPYNAPS